MTMVRLKSPYVADELEFDLEDQPEYDDIVTALSYDIFLPAGFLLCHNYVSYGSIGLL